MKKNTDHVITYDATHGDRAYSFECRHCGATHAAMPVDGQLSLSMWLAMAKQFGRDHKDCKPRNIAAQVK